MNIRYEIPADIEAIYTVNQQAFERPGEGDVVNAIRKSGQFTISLVAEDGGKIVGHIFFSPVKIDGFDAKALGLGPMAVLPEYQRQGIGSHLIEQGLQECKTHGYGVVVVLGHPEYYPKFGFAPARNLGLTCKWDVPDEVFMAQEVIPGGLGNLRGMVEYDPAFDAV